MADPNITTTKPVTTEGKDPSANQAITPQSNEDPNNRPKIRIEVGPAIGGGGGVIKPDVSPW